MSVSVKSASIGNEKNITPEQILAEANDIWNRAKVIWAARGATEEDTDFLDKVYNDFRVDHRELFSSYPTVMRHMLQEQYYHPEAFRKYLQRIRVRPWTNDETRMDSYADYMVLLYKEMNPKWKRNEVDELRRDYRARAQHEHDKFREKFEKNRHDVEQEERKYDQERRADLKTILQQLGSSLGTSIDESKYTTEELERIRLALEKLGAKKN